MSYGTEAGVAALTKRYGDSTTHLFTTATNPTLATVTSWLAQISSMVNVALASAGFTTPITDADLTPALDGFVNALTADLAHAANSTGRFFSDRALEYGISPIKAISNDVRGWVEMMTPGLSALGAVRETSDADRIAFRDGDENGNAVNPMFTRGAFGGWGDTGES